jgi:hypothetical protein
MWRRMRHGRAILNVKQEVATTACTHRVLHISSHIINLPSLTSHSFWSIQLEYEYKHVILNDAFVFYSVPPRQYLGFVLKNSSPVKSDFRFSRWRVFWVVTPCSVVEVYRRFRSTYNPEDSHLQLSSHLPGFSINRIQTSSYFIPLQVLTVSLITCESNTWTEGFDSLLENTCVHICIVDVRDVFNNISWPNVVVWRLALLIRICEVLESNGCLEDRQFRWVFSWISSVPPGSCRDNTLN